MVRPLHRSCELVATKGIDIRQEKLVGCGGVNCLFESSLAESQARVTRDRMISRDRNDVSTPEAPVKILKSALLSISKPEMEFSKRHPGSRHARWTYWAGMRGL